MGVGGATGIIFSVVGGAGRVRASLSSTILGRFAKKLSSLLLLMLEDSACEYMPGTVFVSSLRDMSSELCRWLRESGVPITTLASKKRRREVCMVDFSVI